MLFPTIRGLRARRIGPCLASTRAHSAKDLSHHHQQVCFMRSRPGDRRLPLLVVDVVSNKPPRPDVTRLFRSLLLNSARAAGVAAIRIGKATAQSDTVPTATPRENQKTHRENQRTNNSPGPMSSGRYIFLITGTANRLRAIPGSHATQPIHACQTRTIASTTCEYRPIANIDLPILPQYSLHYLTQYLPHYYHITHYLTHVVCCQTSPS